MTVKKFLAEVEPGHWVDTRQPLRVVVHSCGAVEADLWPRPEFPMPWWLVDIRMWMNNYCETPVRVAFKTKPEALQAAAKFVALIDKVIASQK